MKRSFLNIALLTVLLGSAALAQSGYFTGRMFSGPVHGGYNSAAGLFAPQPIMNIGGNEYFFGPAAAYGNDYVDLLAQDAAAQQAARAQQAAATANEIPRRNDSIDANIDKDGKFFVTWRGEPTLVNRVKFAVLDRDRKTISEQVITRLPVQARFALTNKTAYYRIHIEYVNGTVTNVTAPL